MEYTPCATNGVRTAFSGTTEAVHVALLDAIPLAGFEDE